MDGYEDKAAFQETFDLMRTKTHKKPWLDSITRSKKNELNVSREMSSV